MKLHTCRICGPKNIQFFSPAEMKRKSAICRKCAKEANERRAVKNHVPADAGFGFEDWKRP